MIHSHKITATTCKSPITDDKEYYVCITGDGCDIEAGPYIVNVIEDGYCKFGKIDWEPKSKFDSDFDFQMLNLVLAAKVVDHTTYIYVVEEDNVGLIDIVDILPLHETEDKKLDAEGLLVK